MATSTIIRKIRASDTLDELMKCKCYFLTLTTKDVVGFVEIRERWRNLRHWFVRRLKCRYIQNFELHPWGHGWHIHAVIDNFVPLKKYLKKIQSFGFGRVDVRRVHTKEISEYLTKHALKAYSGISKSTFKLPEGCRLRLVNQSRGLPSLSDYYQDSPYLQHLKKVRKLNGIGSRLSFRAFHNMELTYFYDTELISEALERLANDVYIYRHWERVEF